MFPGMMCMLQRTMHQINKLIMVSQLASGDELIKNKPLPNGKMSVAEANVCGETYSAVQVISCKHLPCF